MKENTLKTRKIEFQKVVSLAVEEQNPDERS
jgi:hypothetical protein